MFPAAADRKHQAVRVRQGSVALLLMGCLLLAPSRLIASDLDDAPVVVAMGGGAVEFEVPPQWDAFEAAEGRRVRLEFYAGERLERLAVWVACEVGRPTRGETLPGVLLNRLKRATRGRAQPLVPNPVLGNGWQGLQCEFQIPATAETPQRRGMHFIAATSWGLCEIHAVTSESGFELHREPLDRMMQSLRIAAPVAADDQMDPLPEQTYDARSIVGLWKAYQSLLQIRPNGQIEIRPDPPGPIPLGQVASDSKPPIRGQFEARKDVLYVVWADGSRLNLRWKLQDHSLLLTDHEGRISQLRRILNGRRPMPAPRPTPSTTPAAEPVPQRLPATLPAVPLPGQSLLGQPLLGQPLP